MYFVKYPKNKVQLKFQLKDYKADKAEIHFKEFVFREYKAPKCNPYTECDQIYFKLDNRELFTTNVNVEQFEENYMNFCDQFANEIVDEFGIDKINHKSHLKALFFKKMFENIKNLLLKQMKTPILVK